MQEDCFVPMALTAQPPGSTAFHPDGEEMRLLQLLLGITFSCQLLVKCRGEHGESNLASAFESSPRPQCAVYRQLWGSQHAGEPSCFMGSKKAKLERCTL